MALKFSVSFVLLALLDFMKWKMVPYLVMGPSETASLVSTVAGERLYL